MRHKWSTARAKAGWQLVVAGQRQPVCEDTGEALFSRDGKRLAYLAKKDGKWRVVVDGAEQKAYDAIGAGTLRFSPDGQILAYAAQSGGKWLLVANGREGKPYDGVSDLVFSPNSKLLASR